MACCVINSWAALWMLMIWLKNQAINTYNIESKESKFNCIPVIVFNPRGDLIMISSIRNIYIDMK